MQKMMDVSRLAQMGLRAQIALDEGISETCSWFLDQDASDLRA